MVSNNRQVETLLSWKLRRLPPSPIYLKKKKKSLHIIRNACRPPWLLLPFPQHLLKPENVPVKSRSFYNKTPCHRLPSFLSGRCPALSTQGGVWETEPACPVPTGLPSVWWVSCPSQACSRGEAAAGGGGAGVGRKGSKQQDQGG